MTFQLNTQKHAQLLTDLPASSALNWLSTLQKDSLQAFCNAKLPNRKTEHFKYNDLTFFKEQLFSISEKQNTGSFDEDFHAIAIENAITLRFVNGVLITPLNTLKSIEGLQIQYFSECNKSQQQQIIERLETSNKNLFLNLNQALINDGLMISVEPNKTITTPIYLQHISSPSNSNSIGANMLFVNLEKSSEITIVEQFESTKASNINLNLQQSFYVLGENSEVNNYRLNLEQECAYQASQVKSFLGRDSVFNGFFVGLGSKLNRTDIDILHQGSNAHCELTGIYLPANEQAIDYHTNIEHQVAHCTSNEVFRGIIADKASATFNGKIHIFQDAQKSDAFLNNKNLLLTNQAEVNTKPELEIYADDVKCAHGATVAQLDDKSVYYLQTRGINAQKARKMLSIAFIQALIDTAKIDSIKQFVQARLNDYMSHLNEK